MKTVIQFSTRVGGELGRIELNDDDATCEAIAAAAIDLISQTGMSMSAGDIIEVFEVEA